MGERGHSPRDRFSTSSTSIAKVPELSQGDYSFLDAIARARAGLSPMPTAKQIAAGALREPTNAAKLRQAPTHVPASSVLDNLQAQQDHLQEKMG